jgi:steroid delta-isomerase-like uncharacterized protein
MYTIGGVALIHRYYAEIANVGDGTLRAAAVDDILATDFVFHAPNDVPGRSGVERHKEFLIWHHGVAPDQCFSIEDVVSDGERAASRWTARGTHQGDFLGIPPTWRQFEVSGIDFWRLQDGRIAELWRAFDLRKMLKQLSTTQ